ncbi:zinc-ribbon domain-containing protein [Enterococcus durans]|uniref:zinc-ribbon domain-containing protein n=2 Tax=Enterococcus TaxID=1350 RepID=UPI0018AC7F57|nr:zinc-ribbon domain-containing protein [Enterococcus durans]
MKFCPECGNKLGEGAKFCSGCGYKVPSVNESGEKNELKKVSSESYIKKVLSEATIDNLSVVPNIDNKLLIPAAKTIGSGVDPSMVLGIINTAIINKGKAGAVFTGKQIYLRGSFGSSIEIPYEDISKVEYEIERNITEKGKKVEIQFLTIDYKYGKSIRIDSQKMDSALPFKFISQILENFEKNVDKIESNNQLVQLSNLSPEIIELYFKAVIAFLKSDDYKISSEEYKELITLMTKVKVTKSIAKNLRDYRFAENMEESFSDLVLLLKAELDKARVSYTLIYQSLAMDIISMNKNKIDNWREYNYITDAMKTLEIGEKQVGFIAKKIKTEEMIISERLNDKQVSKLTNKLATIASGTGVSLGALAVTSTVAGWGGSIPGGLLAISAVPGGTLLGLATIASVGAYQGIKYLSGTGELEKSSIRISALTTKIEQLRAANVYIIDDINWLVMKISSFAYKLKESEELNNEMMDQMITMINQSQNIAKSGVLVEKDQEDMELEYVIANLPEKLDVERYDELISKDINHIQDDQIIKEIYLPSPKEDSVYLDKKVQSLNVLYLNEKANIEMLRHARQILENIGYFDTKALAAAQSKIVTKKAKSKLKNLLGGE